MNRKSIFVVITVSCLVSISLSVEADCSSGQYVSHFDWMDLLSQQQDKPECDMIKFDIQESDLSINIIVDCDLLGEATANHDTGFPVSYVLDFEDFGAVTDSMSKPGSCQNRDRDSFLNQGAELPFNQWWGYTNNPNDIVSRNGGNFMSYPSTDGTNNKWDIISLNTNTSQFNDDVKCGKIRYNGHFTWQDLVGCTDYNQQDTYLDIDRDDKWINMTGVFYINVVSPFWNDGTDYGFYRVYQIMSAPFVIAVSKTVHVLGSTGINLFTMTVIGVYKENMQNDFRMVMLTESADYLFLRREDNVLFDTTNTNQYTFTAPMAAVSGEHCLSNEGNLCTQLFEINADLIECVEANGGTDISGDYSLAFIPECYVSADNETKTYCNDWLNDHPDIKDGITLTAGVDWKDTICDPQIYIVQFEGYMEFYSDSSYTAPVESDYLFFPLNTIYVQTTIDFPDNTYTIFETSLTHVWICTFPITITDQDIGDPNELNGGCFSTHVDTNEFFHIFNVDTGDTFQNTAVLSHNQQTNVVRFKFDIPDTISRDKLYVHTQIEISLSNQNNRRRRILTRSLLFKSMEPQKADRLNQFGDYTKIKIPKENKHKKDTENNKKDEKEIKIPQIMPTSTTQSFHTVIIVAAIICIVFCIILLILFEKRRRYYSYSTIRTTTDCDTDSGTDNLLFSEDSEQQNNASQIPLNPKNENKV